MGTLTGRAGTDSNMQRSGRQGLVSRADAPPKEDIMRLNIFLDIYLLAFDLFFVNCPIRLFVSLKNFFLEYLQMLIIYSVLKCFVTVCERGTKISLYLYIYT